MKRDPERLHVSVNMAMSLDGRITTRRRERMTLGSKHDRRLMDELRAEADAVIVGAGTVRHDGFPIVVRNEDILQKAAARRPDPHPVNVILSRTLDIPTARPIFLRKETEKVIFTTSEAPASRVRRLSKVAEVVVLKRRTLSPSVVLEHLRRRGMERVLLEGGGEVHFAFAREHVVDEIYITLTPRLIGGQGAPTILDGRGFLKKDHIRLKLVSCTQVSHEVFLRYRVLY